MFPSLPIGAGAHKYLRLPSSRLPREWMPIVTFPTKDKSPMFVGVCGFFVQWGKGLMCVSRRACPTCGSKQQWTVVSIQVLHGRDARVSRVAVVEVVQPLAFLPIPETEQTGNKRQQWWATRPTQGSHWVSVICFLGLTRCCPCRPRRCRHWRDGTWPRTGRQGCG